MNKLICKECNYETVVCDFDTEDFSNICPVCGGNLEIGNEAKDNELATIKREIDIAGDTAIWDSIEYIADYKERLKRRGLFIRVGGKIPERELELN